MSRYICTECTRRFENNGDCPQCEGEPLLDLQHEDVVLMLQEQDDRTARTRHYAIVMTFSVTGFVIGVLGGLVLSEFVDDLSPRLFQLAMVGPAALGGFVGETMYRLFPAKRILPSGG